jgi:hypothetical protein
MKRSHLAVVGAVLLLATLGCSVLSAEDAPAEPQPAEPQPAPAQPAVPVGPPCDTRARSIELNQSYDEQMHQATGPYPGNCLYYCAFVPPGQDQLEVEIRDFNTDLDLFIGFGTMEAVMGEEVVEGETYTWKSNATGTADENVSIRNPEEGNYYIEVCSYEGEASPFELETNLR